VVGTVSTVTAVVGGSAVVVGVVPVVIPDDGSAGVEADAGPP
jgi:hypothetical protein